eukprot:11124147-Ditylum_brightwellii.AAC.1
MFWNHHVVQLYKETVCHADSGIHEGIHPDSSMNYAKLTNKNKNNTPSLFYTVITPQNDKENTKQTDINSTLIYKPSN